MSLDVSVLGHIDVAWGATSSKRFALHELVDSSDLLHGGAPNFVEIRARLARDGYVFLRGLLEEQKVNAARRRINRYLARLGMVDTEYGGDRALDFGRMMGGRCRGITLSGASVTKTQEVLSLLEGGGGGSGALGLEAFFEGLFRVGEGDLSASQQHRARGAAIPEARNAAAQAEEEARAEVGDMGAVLSLSAAAASAATGTGAAETQTAITTAAKETAQRTAFTFETKWMRVMGGGESTSAHSDAYFFDCNVGGEYPGLLTCWTPLGDAPIESGPLAVCSGTHALPGFAVSPGDAMVPPDEVRIGGERGLNLLCLLLQTKRASAPPSQLPPAFAAYAESGECERDRAWRSTNFKAGDALIFDARLVHGSGRNETEYFRVSVDTRWMRRSVYERAAETRRRREGRRGLRGGSGEGKSAGE